MPIALVALGNALLDYSEAHPDEYPCCLSRQGFLYCFYAMATIRLGAQGSDSNKLTTSRSMARKPLDAALPRPRFQTSFFSLL